MKSKMSLDTALQILDLNKGCTEPELKKSFRAKAKLYHTDKGSGDHEKFVKIVEANELVAAYIKNPTSVTVESKMDDIFSAFKENIRNIKIELEERDKAAEVHTYITSRRFILFLIFGIFVFAFPIHSLTMILIHFGIMGLFAFSFIKMPRLAVKKFGFEKFNLYLKYHGR